MSDQDKKHKAWLSHMKTGTAQFQQGKLKEASLSFNKAIRIFPERVEAWINIGSSLLQAGQVEDAVKTLGKAVSLNNRQAVSHMLLGDALRLKGQRGDALQCYRVAVSLEKTPISLNKLACELRFSGELDEAEKLYQEALELNPKFSTAQVNLATLEVVRGDFSKAEELLETLAKKTLPPRELQEVESIRAAVSEYSRLAAAIDTMAESSDLTELELLLENTPANVLEVDHAALQTFDRYRMPAPDAYKAETLGELSLPEDWPLVEAMHMIPFVHSRAEYLAIKAKLEDDIPLSSDLLESLNMERAIRAARTSHLEMDSPVKAELHIRHWHALACHKIVGLHPGHFKYTRNWTGGAAGLERVDPARASGTFRYAVSNIYTKLPPGLERAVMLFLVVLDLHAFSDGNARVAATWLNRELEYAGMVPVIFTREKGFTENLGQTIRTVRTNGGDLTPLITAIIDAQQYSREFLAELATPVE